MRKSFLMGLGLAASLASLAVAQQRGGPEGAFGRRGPGQQLLKGITLTDAQKTQLKTLRESQRAAMESNHGAAKTQFEAVRAARQKGDTAAARVLMAKMRTEMDQKRAQEFASIRNILTPDQRVAFDKNVAELKQREQERASRVGDRGNGGKGGKGFRGHKPGQG